MSFVFDADGHLLWQDDAGIYPILQDEDGDFVVERADGVHAFDAGVVEQVLVDDSDDQDWQDTFEAGVQKIETRLDRGLTGRERDAVLADVAGDNDPDPMRSYVELFGAGPDPNDDDDRRALMAAYIEDAEAEAADNEPDEPDDGGAQVRGYRLTDDDDDRTEYMTRVAEEGESIVLENDDPLVLEAEAARVEAA